MAEPTEKTIKHLFALSGNICAYPDCTLPIVEGAGTITGEVCHIRAKNPRGPRFDPAQTEEERHGFENLILLCRHHHRVVDSQTEIYSVEVLQEMKAIHENGAGRSAQAADGFFAKILLNDYRRVRVVNNTGNVAINSPGAIQANIVNVRTMRRTLSVNAPTGTIGADQHASRYVQYLIKRYNEFASANTQRAKKFNYGAVSKNIEDRFGSSWKLLPIEKFDVVCEYLQQRISKTIIAKLNASKGKRSFSTYIEFLEK